MTIQEAYKKIMNSEDLKKKAIEAAKNGKADEFLKEQGIDLTFDQIQNYVKAKKSGELTKEELDMAAGGCDDSCNATILSIAGLGFACLASIFIGLADDDDSTFSCV